MARLFCNMAILNMLQIQNEQVYSFYVMVNVFLFLVMGFTFLFVMSYLLGSPRPEKTMLRMLDRFFRSAEFLMSRTGADASRLSLLDRWRMAFHRRQLQSMPAKLAAWGKAIDRTHVPTRRPSTSRPWSSAFRPWSTASSSSSTRADPAGRRPSSARCGTSSELARGSRSHLRQMGASPRGRACRLAPGAAGGTAGPPLEPRLAEVVTRADAIWARTRASGSSGCWAATEACRRRPSRMRASRSPSTGRNGGRSGSRDRRTHGVDLRRRFLPPLLVAGYSACRSRS